MRNFSNLTHAHVTRSAPYKLSVAKLREFTSNPFVKSVRLSPNLKQHPWFVAPKNLSICSRRKVSPARYYDGEFRCGQFPWAQFMGRGGFRARWIWEFSRTNWIFKSVLYTPARFLWVWVGYYLKLLVTNFIVNQKLSIDYGLTTGWSIWMMTICFWHWNKFYTLVYEVKCVSKVLALLSVQAVPCQQCKDL